MTIWEIFPECCPRSNPHDSKYRRARRGWEEVNLRFSVSPIMIDDKNTAGYVWCFDDLTELRVLERQMRQKEQMAAIGVNVGRHCS